MVNPVHDSSSIKKFSKWLDVFLLSVLAVANLLFPLFGLSSHTVTLIRLLFLFSLIVFFIFARLPLFFIESVADMFRSRRERSRIWASRKNFLIKNLVFILVFLFVLNTMGVGNLKNVVSQELAGKNLSELVEKQESFGLEKSSEKRTFVLKAQGKDFKSDEDAVFRVGFTDTLSAEMEMNEATSSSEPKQATAEPEIISVTEIPSATASATPAAVTPTPTSPSTPSPEAGPVETAPTAPTPENTQEATISARPLRRGLAKILPNLPFLKSTTAFVFAKVQQPEPEVEAKVFDVNGNEVDFPVSVESAGDGSFEINISKERAFRPGKYKLEVTLVDAESGEEIDSIEQDFTWGVLAVNTNKSIYLPEEEAKLQIAVLDEEGMMECNADVKLQITNSKLQIEETLSTEEGTIQVNPECELHDFTLEPDYEALYQVEGSGVYEMELTAETENGTYTITDSFEVCEEVPFDVERKSVTRIYPPENYPMTFSIDVNQDFTGVIEEQVPAGFEVECPALFDVDSGDRSNSCQIREEDGVKTISWFVSWAEGQKTTLYYRFRTPPTSPQFYLLGPLMFKSEIRNSKSETNPNVQNSNELDGNLIFQEARRWQLAIDDTEGANSPSSGVEDTSVGSISWTGYTNVYSNDDTNYATVNLEKTQSYYIKATGFGFSLSNCASIDGIYVEVDRKTNDTTNAQDYSVRLVNGSGTIVGDNKAKTDTWPTSDAYQTYGGSADTWNASLTCSDVTNSNFGVVFSSQSTQTTGKPVVVTNSVDHIRVTITYTASGPSPALEQTHYQWRDDSYGLNTDNGWQASEDSAYSGLEKSTTARLRMEVDNTGDAEASSYQYQLEYAAQSGGTCGGETYTTVPVTASTEHFEMVTSSQYADGDNTTSGFLTGSGTWADGEGVEDPSNQTVAHSLTNGYYTEHEYAIQATSNATDGGTYCFRLTNSGSTANFTYTKYAEATIPGVTGSLGKSSDGWNGAIPVYMTLTGLSETTYQYARAKVDTAASETYYFDMTWDSGDSRYEGTIYPGSYYCNGCADPTTGSFTVTVQLSDTSDFSPVDYSDSAGTFSTYITRRKSSLDTSADYTDIKPVWNTDHWDVDIADFALYCSSSQTNAVIAVPFHPTTASISNIAVSYDSTSVSQGSAESTTDAWWWDSDYHTLYLMFDSCSTTIVDVDISFDSDTDLWATRFDRVQTADMGNREFYNGLFIGNQYWTTSVYGGGHEGAGEQAESRAKPSGGDELTVDCMERVSVWADADDDSGTTSDLNCDSSGYYECNIKWAQDEWDSWIISESNDQIVIETNEDQTASTGWAQYLTSSISVERILTFYSGKIYVGNTYTITNNDSVAHDLDLLHEREQWLAGDRNTNDRGRYDGDTADRTMDSRVDMSTLTDPWLTSYDNYDTGYYASMGFIFEEGAEADYGIFTDHAFITNTSAEWPVVIGSEGHTEAQNTGFELSNSSVAAGNSVVLNYWQTLYIGSSWSDLETKLDAAATEVNTSLSGHAYTDEGTTALDGSSTPKTVNLQINGSGSYTDEITTSDGAWEVSGMSLSSGDIITVYLDDETEEAATVLVSDGTEQTNIDLYQNRVVARADTGSLTNSNLSTGDDGDDDIKYNVSSGNLTVDTGFELHVLSGDTFAPGGNVTADNLHVEGTYSGGSETLTLAGSGTGDCTTEPGTIRPLCIDGGTFTASSNTVSFEGTSNSNIEATTYNNVQFAPASGTPTYYIVAGTLATNGTFTLSSTGGVTVDAETNDPTLNIDGNFSIGASDTFQASSTGTFNLGAGYANSGTFTANSGTVTFDAGSTGHTIVSGGTGTGYDFNNLEFNNSAGGWTIQTNNLTTTGNLTITDTAASGFTVNSVTVEVKGTYSIAAAETANTTWTSATLYLNSGSAYTVGSKSQSTETYSTLQIGASTDIRIWNSSASTYTVDATGSLYSQDHTATDGDLYIWGDYHTQTNDYWSYATDFDGADLTGSERQVSVYIDTSGGVTVDSGDTLAVIGGSSARTAVTRQGASNGYTFTVAGGGINFQYADFDYLDGNKGIDIQASSTVTSLDNTAFDNLVGTANTDDAFITVDYTVIGSGTKTISGVQFDNTGTGAEFNVNRTTGSDTGYWDFDSHTGTFDGEDYDGVGGSDEASPGMLRWDDSVTNTAPNSPTSLAQKKTDDTVLSVGDWTNESSVKFTATVDDPDASDTLYLCVEKDPTGTAFSDTEDLCGTGVSYSGSPVTATVTISSQTDATTYHWQARVKDEAGAYSSWVSYGGNTDPNDTDYGIDTTAPTGGTVYDGTETGVDKDFNDESLSQLSANWSGVDSTVSGLDHYEYSIGTTQGGTDVVGWTTNGTSTSVTEPGLTLQTSQTYYFNVRAVDSAGSTQSPVISSDGQVVSPSLSFSVAPATVTFDALNDSNSYTDTETVTLETSTNAYNGYVIRGFASDYLRSASGNETVPDFDGGTYASPDGWLTGDRGFGYNSSDTSVQGSNIFNSTPCPGGNSPPCYAPFSQTAPGDIVADHTANVTGSPISSEQFTLTYKVQTDSIQASSTYVTTIIYTITPQY